MTMRKTARHVIWFGVASVCCACCGVPKQAVSEGASIIERNAVAAEALHERCLSGGDASVAACDDEHRTLEGIRSTARALSVKAGVADAGGDT